MHGSTTRRPWHVTVLRDLQGSQSEPPCSSCAPPTPTTVCRNSSGASSTSSWRRSRPSCSPPRAASADGLVIGDGTKRNTTPQRGDESTFTLAADPLGSTGREVTPSSSQTFDQLDTANIPARQAVVCLDNNCHKARLGRAAPIGSGTRMRHEPAHVAHRQPEAVPEEQRVDFLQTFFEFPSL